MIEKWKNLKQEVDDIRKPNIFVGFFYIYTYNNGVIAMAKIKESDLKKIFDSYGLDEGIFDLFNKKVTLNFFLT